MGWWHSFPSRNFILIPSSEFKILSHNPDLKYYFIPILNMRFFYSNPEHEFEFYPILTRVCFILSPKFKFHPLIPTKNNLNFVLHQHPTRLFTILNFRTGHHIKYFNPLSAEHFGANWQHYQYTTEVWVFQMSSLIYARIIIFDECLLLHTGDEVHALLSSLKEVHIDCHLKRVDNTHKNNNSNIYSNFFLGKKIVSTPE